MNPSDSNSPGNAVVSYGLKGETRFDWRAEGLACEIVLPAGAIVSSEMIVRRES